MNDDLEKRRMQVQTLETKSFCIDPYEKVSDATILPPTSLLQHGQVSDFRCTDLHTIRIFDWRPREDIKPGARDETLVCVHGLFRNAHDFDFLAERLCIKGYRAARTCRGVAEATTLRTRVATPQRNIRSTAAPYSPRLAIGRWTG